MNKSYLAVAIAVVAILAIGGVVALNSRDEAPVTKNDMNHSGMNDTMSDSKQDSPSTMTPASANSIDIKDYAFQPAKITVKKGTTVSWTNQDSDRHDVTPTDESTDFKASKLLAKGESYSYTFNTAGTFSYYCSPHPYMKGTVEVTE